jgi:exosortase
MEVAVRFLQQGSAEATHTLFNGIGIPVVRHGFQFDLPGLAIEVAEECSGVHSAVALLIASTLAAHFFLRSTWKQILFVLLAVPIAILKNAIRIVLISALTLYVDPAIIDGPLHHQGGPVFAVVGLTLLAPLLYVLWKTEVYSHPDPSLPQR